MKQIIYADNAATTKLCNAAFEAMKPYLSEFYGNASALYSIARQSKEALNVSRKKIAKIINADPEEIFFTSGGSEGDNWAIKGTAFAMQTKGKHIIVSSIEHHAILNSCKFLETLGFSVTYLPCDKNGNISCRALEDAITSETILVSIMLANNEIGTIENIKELTDVAHSHHILFHTDAVQAVGHIPVDVKLLGVDMLSASAHKFNGPKGVGFFYKKKKINIFELLSGGSQENHQRAGTENIAAIVGMATALEVKSNNMSQNNKIIEKLRKEFFIELNKTDLDYIENGNVLQLPGIISISFKNVSGEMILHRLDLKGICISTGSACNSKITELSHVIKAINLQNDYSYGTIRISLDELNTCNEIKTIISEIKNIFQ